jgi:hypothetical protein
MIAVMLLAGSAVSGNHQDNARHGVDQLPGSWHVEITANGGPTFPALFSFTRDGAMITSESPGPFESAGHGSWIGRGREAAFTFFALVGSPAGGGQNTMKLKVVGTLETDVATGGWSGEFKIQVFDTAGHLLFENGGTLQLTRIAVESL